MSDVSSVSLTHYLIVSSVMFTIGLLGIMTNRNAVRVLLALELMMSAIGINLVAFNNYSHLNTGLVGQVFTIFVLTVSAAEASVGLAIIIALYRSRGTADMEQFNLLKW